MGAAPDVPAVSPTAGCRLATACAEEVRALLDRRSQLNTELARLDAEAERLARAVQRVGGASAGSRAFTGAPPVVIEDSSSLDMRIERLTEEMGQLTSTISGHELDLHELERPGRRRALMFTLLLVVAAAVALGVFLAVR